nr:N-6 DNA methylase [Candidatus Sigynarchaeum springense]MDO8116868.1 N-6 DNA methylase [Candidatus Sigynarchaeota archaeon]
MDEIEGNIEDLELETKEVPDYLQDLRGGSSPEIALMNSFFAGTAGLSKILFGHNSPEMSTTEGSIDCEFEEKGIPTRIEIKHFFYARKDTEGSGKKIKLSPLLLEKYAGQIEKSLLRKEYVAITNIKEWYFFSKRNRTPINTEPIFFDDLVIQLTSGKCLADYIEKLEFIAGRGKLDEMFFCSLKDWIAKLSEVQYTQPDKDKIEELVAGFINKFVFVMTLDDHFAIKPNWIKNEWIENETKWLAIGKEKVIDAFLNEVNLWFYKHYEIDLFKTQLFDFVEKSPANIELFYKNIRLVLGLESWQHGTRYRGITSYNYRLISEDVFGKAYENILAEDLRTRSGVYYTRNHITKYMVDSTVGTLFGKKIASFQDLFNEAKYKEAEKVLDEIQSIKILDPACGSGSFLIKSFKVIWEQYKILKDFLKVKKASKIKDEFIRSSASLWISEIEKKLGFGNDKLLVSRIVLRHLFGQDIDMKAISIAKVNLWLEAIKQVPHEYHFELAKGGHVLPNLNLNLRNGDSLFLFQGTINDDLVTKNGHDIDTILKLLNEYIDDPLTKHDDVDKIIELENKIKRNFQPALEEYFKSKGVDLSILGETVPTMWIINFLMAFMNSDSRLAANPGFDIVLGNPPYVNANIRTKYFSRGLNACWKKLFVSARGAYDLYLLFLELGLNLCKKDGMVTFIVPNKHLSAPYAQSFRSFFLSNPFFMKSLADVSLLDVFDEPDVYPIVPVYQKIQPPASAKIHVVKPKTIAQINEVTTGFLHDHEKLGKLPEKLWGFLLLPDDSTFFDIWERCEPLEKHGTVQASSSTNESSLYTAAMSEYDPTRTGSNKKFIKTGGIDPFQSLWGYVPVTHQGADLLKPVLDTSHPNMSSLRKAQFSKQKLVFAKICTQLEVFPDLDGKYASSDTNFFYDGKRDIAFYGGLMNSHVVHYMYSGLFGALRMRAGDFQVQAPQIKLIPVPRAISDDQAAAIQDLTRKIVDIKANILLFYSIWKSVTSKFKDADKKLSEILIAEKANLLGRDPAVCWSSSVSIFPGSTDVLLEKAFQSFTLRPKAGNVLSIWGINGAKSEEVFHMRFSDASLMDYLMCAIECNLLETGKSRATLNDIFEKAMVPIIEDPTNAVSKIKKMMVKIIAQFKAEASFPHFPTPIYSVSDLMMKQHELEHELNENVFKLYAVNKAQIAEMLDYLDVLDLDRAGYR